MHTNSNEPNNFKHSGSIAFDEFLKQRMEVYRQGAEPRRVVVPERWPAREDFDPLVAGGQ